MTGTAHPSYTLSGLCILGGTLGFVRTRSVPSLIAGLSLGSIYAWSAHRISIGQAYGLESAAVASALLTAAGLARFRRATVPKVLAGTGLVSTTYFGKQVADYGYGA